MDLYTDDDFVEVPDVPRQEVRLSRRDLINSRARLRSQINRDNESSAKRSSEMARSLLTLSANHNVSAGRNNSKVEALAYAVSGLAGKVLNSLGLTPRISVDSDPYAKTLFSAKTDFTNIEIGVTRDETLFNIDNMEQMGEVLAIVKGLIYHEGGHLLWTTPYPKLELLVAQALGDDDDAIIDVALSGEIVNKYAPDLLAKDVNIARALDAPVLQLRRAWNILEDQRMETAMCSTSPVMARYFTHIVENIVLDDESRAHSWPFIVGRTYLPREIRQEIRNTSETHPYAAIIPLIDELVMTYRSSNDPMEMYKCIRSFTECMFVWGAGVLPGGSSGVDTHEPNRFSKESRDFIEVPNPGDWNMEQPSVKGDTTSKTDGDSSSTSNGPESSDDNKGETGTPGVGKSEQTKSDELINKREVTSFIEAVNEYIASDIKPMTSYDPMTAEQVKGVDEVSNGMRNVLEQLVVQVDPSWSHYQEDGVLDPVAYELRQPGDTAFWSGLDGVGGNGHNLAVSLLIDNSGSMAGAIDGVTIAGIGIKKACDELGINCTVVTFNDVTRMVSRGDEPSSYVSLGAGGGTSIFPALNNLNNQRYGKDYHLVVILTDGEWYDVNDLRMWSDPGRYFLLVGYNMDDKLLRNKGANQVVVIDKVLDLPKLVVQQLTTYFS